MLRFTRTNLPVTEHALSVLHSRFGITLPESLLEIYKISDGGSLNSSVHRGYYLPGFEHDDTLSFDHFIPILSDSIFLDSILDIHDDWSQDKDLRVPEDLVCFAAAGGGFWLIGHSEVNKGKIFYMDSISEVPVTIHFVHETLEDFLSNLETKKTDSSGPIVLNDSV